MPGMPLAPLPSLVGMPGMELKPPPPPTRTLGTGGPTLLPPILGTIAPRMLDIAALRESAAAELRGAGAALLVRGATRDCVENARDAPGADARAACSLCQGWSNSFVAQRALAHWNVTLGGSILTT